MALESWTVTEETRLAAEVKRALDLSHRKAQGLIDRGAVKVGGSVVTDHGTKLAPGDAIEVRTDAPRATAAGGKASGQKSGRGGKKEPPALAEILFEDRHLLVIAKPSGVLTIPGENQRSLPLNRRDPNLEDWLRARDLARGATPSIFIVQRLDRGTSGVLLFPRSRYAADLLKPAFAKHTIERRYRAIVVGSPPPEGTLTHRLIEKRGRVIEAHPTEPGAKEAITHFKTLESRNGLARLELRLETGRRNQIRVGCSLSGFPILGDRTYGEPSPAIERPALHAHSLGFSHPHSGEPMQFTMDEPADFQSAWASSSAGE